MVYYPVHQNRTICTYLSVNRARTLILYIYITLFLDTLDVSLR
jgi:hypothetical protein